ncbi:MAG: toxin-antitoxin system HicB family antitoxin [Agathobacter sp.]|nr:toxin-antitoxin system HicB family antitoxin [Agathobacter sp.]
MTITEYMKLPYTRLVQEMNDESGHYFYGRILELDGCQSTGETLEELYENLSEAMEGYLEVKLENHLPIPLPNLVSDYSGKFVIRLPKTLHQRLAIEAEQEGVSLNQWALYKLASTVTF